MVLQVQSMYKNILCPLLVESVLQPQINLNELINNYYK